MAETPMVKRAVQHLRDLIIRRETTRDLDALKAILEALARRDALLREALQYLDMGKWSDLKQRIEAELGDSHD